MHNKNVVVAIFTVILLIGTLSGCGGKAKKISLKDSLINNGVNVREIGGATQQLEIVECDEINKNEINDSRLYTVDVLMSNTDYEVSGTYSLNYNYNKQNKEWTLVLCDEKSIDITPLRGWYPDNLEEKLSRIAGVWSSDNVIVSNVEHNFSSIDKTDVITADYTDHYKYYDESGRITLTGEFRNNDWNYNADRIQIEKSKQAWNFDELMGTWRIDVPAGNYATEIKIIDVDEDKMTITYQEKNHPSGFTNGGHSGLDYLDTVDYSEVLEKNYRISNDAGDVENGFTKNQGKPRLYLVYGKYNTLMVEEDRVFDAIHGHGMYFAEKID